MCTCIYTYCVTHEEVDLAELKGIDEYVYPIEDCGLVTVARKVSGGDFSEKNLPKNIQNVVWLETKVREHHRIVHALAGCVTLLPFKFAAVFCSEENVKAMLRRYELPIKERLQQLIGKQEWGLKVWGDYDEVADYVDASSNEMRNMKKELVKSSPGKALLLKKKKDGLLKNAVHSFFYEKAQECIHGLIPYSYKNILQGGMTVGSSEIGLKAAFLVAGDETESFLHEIEKKREALKAATIDLECTGPWPPYNFIDIVRLASHEGDRGVTKRHGS